MKCLFYNKIKKYFNGIKTYVFTLMKFGIMNCKNFLLEKLLLPLSVETI